MTIYSIFVRNHGGKFAVIEKDIPRIKALGVDMIWLLPIHPIGKKQRKGRLGSPYAIADYRSVNPEYGSMEDFRHFADVVHASGMKLMIDVVYNHTSPDSWLAQHHPEWFYHKPDGSFGNRIGDWSDIIDLDYSQPGLWDYQIETLKMWAEVVDGFRCDVAPLVPLSFGPRLHEFIRALFDREKARFLFTVGESGVHDIDEMIRHCAAERNELSTLFLFDHMECGRADKFTKKADTLKSLRDILVYWQQETANHDLLHTLFSDNHDQSPLISRIADDGKLRYESATDLATIGKRIHFPVLIVARSRRQIGGEAHCKIAQRHGPVHAGDEPDNA